MTFWGVSGCPDQMPFGLHQAEGQVAAPFYAAPFFVGVGLAGEVGPGRGGRLQ